MFAVYPKTNCPHIEKSNLFDLKAFKKIPFRQLKCKKCEEKDELWICLICGESYCSRYKNSHFVEHNKDNPEHCICLGILDLSVWCYECINEKKKGNQEDIADEKGSYIISNISNQYIKIIEKFKFGEEEKVSEKKNEEEIKDNLEKKENYRITIEKKNEICSHVKEGNIINEFKNYLETYLKQTIKMEQNNKDKDISLFGGICLICGDKIHYYEDLEKHYNIQKHTIYINIKDSTIVCMECKSQYNITIIDDIKYRILFQFLFEKNINIPNETKLLSKEEIYEIKYKKIINNFKNKKFSKVLFMVGAGISTSAGIPDFRSQTGLFKQLQDKYGLSSPEEFFYLPTFLKNPMYFYEFTKLFDLSKVDATISHKFMNFFVKKNIVKYIFTQNIDGLEKKAKIPDEYLIYAHGNFYNGHCPKCKCSIDIEKINEGIQKGKIYYCPKCNGPCKPNVVFYGENLPIRFFKKLNECHDIDLIIIMGTSLKVQPFANIPGLTNPNCLKIVFNMEKVGDYEYDYLEDESIFIKGKTDQNVIKFLKDIELFNEFSEFIKKEYNEDINMIIGKEKELINVNESKNKDNEENKVEKLTEEIKNLDLNKNK